MRISDWSSDVCSSDLPPPPNRFRTKRRTSAAPALDDPWSLPSLLVRLDVLMSSQRRYSPFVRSLLPPIRTQARSEEHTSELQSLMRISYAVFCLKKPTTTKPHIIEQIHNPVLLYNR